MRQSPRWRVTWSNAPPTSNGRGRSHPQADPTTSVRGRAPTPPNPFCLIPMQSDPAHRECLRHPNWSVGRADNWGLMEVDQVEQVVGPHGPEEAYCIPLQGSKHQPLLDSGAMQSLIQRNLVRPKPLVEALWAAIKCGHRNV